VSSDDDRRQATEAFARSRLLIPRPSCRETPSSHDVWGLEAPGWDAFADVEGVGGRQKALKRSTGDLFEGLQSTSAVTSHAAGDPSPSKDRTASVADFDDEPGLFPEMSSSR
jgi:hypothetical protein